jgi:hypothetical protein
MPNAMKPIASLNEDEFAHLAQYAIALADAPPSLVRAAIDLWPASPPVAWKSVAEAALHLAIAALRFDSWARPPVAMGMRAAVSDTRHLLFSALGRDIDLRISPAADHFTLTGQVLGPEEPGMVELIKHSGDGLNPSDSRVAPLDALGEFRLDRVRGGAYRLTLRVGGDEIALPPIVVGERPE